MNWSHHFSSRHTARSTLVLAIGLALLCFVLVACSSGSDASETSGSDAPVRDCKIQGFACQPRVGKSDTISLIVNPKLQTAIASGTATFATSDCTLTTSRVNIGYVPGGADIMLDFKCAGSVPKKLDGTISITYAFENGEPTRSTGTVHLVTS
jgi:hypothetical protein